MIARWPGKIPANSKSDHLISQIDLMATFAAIVDRPLKDGEGLDSIDQLETLTGTPENPERGQLMLCPNSPSHLAVRKGKWVYIPAQNEGGFNQTKIGDHGFGGAAVFKLTGQVNSDVVDGSIRKGAAPGQLYDMEKDRSQTTNVYTEHADVVKELDAIVENYRKKIGSYKDTGYIAIRKRVKKKGN